MCQWRCTGHWTWMSGVFCTTTAIKPRQKLRFLILYSAGWRSFICFHYSPVVLDAERREKKKRLRKAYFKWSLRSWMEGMRKTTTNMSLNIWGWEPNNSVQYERSHFVISTTDRPYRLRNSALKKPRSVLSVGKFVKISLYSFTFQLKYPEPSLKFICSKCRNQRQPRDWVRRLVSE